MTTYRTPGNALGYLRISRVFLNHFFLFLCMMSTPAFTSNRAYRRHIKKKNEEWRVSPELRTGYQETILLSARHDCFARSQLSVLITLVERAETKLKEQIIAKDPLIMYALETAKAISRDLARDRLCPTEKDIIRDAIDDIGEILARAQTLVALRSYPPVPEKHTDEENDAPVPEYRESRFSTFSNTLDIIKKNPDRDLGIGSFVTTSPGPFSTRLAPVLSVPHNPSLLVPYTPVTEDSIVMGSTFNPDDLSDSSDDEPYEFQHCTEEEYQAFLANCRKNPPVGVHPDLASVTDLSKTIGKH